MLIWTGERILPFWFKVLPHMKSSKRTRVEELQRKLASRDKDSSFSTIQAPPASPIVRREQNVKVSIGLCCHHTSPWIWKGVSSTLLSGRYTLSYPRHNVRHYLTLSYCTGDAETLHSVLTLLFTVLKWVNLLFFQEELDDLIATECFYCGDIMIRYFCVFSYLLTV